MNHSEAILILHAVHLQWPTCSFTSISQSAGLVWNKERQVDLNYNQCLILNVQQKSAFGNSLWETSHLKKEVLTYSSLQCPSTTESVSMLLTEDSFNPSFLQSFNALCESNEPTTAGHL